MMTRRGFTLAMSTGLVALGLVVGSVIADELLGVITKVDVAEKQLTVLPKDSEKEIKVKVTEKTERITNKGSRKLDLERLEKSLEKAQDKGAKGIEVKITHENN